MCIRDRVSLLCLHSISRWNRDPVAAGHVTIYPSKTAGWVGAQLHLLERTIKYPTLPADFSTTQIPGGHVTSRNQGLND